jgi:hypothetical protein
MILVWERTNMTIEKEFKFYKDHQSELVEKYHGRFIVIKGESVIADYGSELEAYTETKKKYETGTFLIQHCLPGEESYTQMFHSRVFFPATP